MADDVNYLVLGSKDAEIEIESFINLGCPFCTLYINTVDELFGEYIEEGRLKHVIKHVDKTKGPLLKGTVANTYLDVSLPEITYNDIKDLLNTRDEWTKNFLKTIQKVEDELDLTEQNDAADRSVAIGEEVQERDITVTPTVFINGERFNFSVKGPSEDIEREFREKLKSL